MYLTESHPELIFEMAHEFCNKYAPDELLLLQLNKRKVIDNASAKAKKPKMYAEALGVGIEENVWLPVVLFVMNVIASDIVASLYRSAKEQLVSYICNRDIEKIEALVGDNKHARETVRKLREMLCEANKNQR